MLINIIYAIGQEKLADVCEYSFRNLSPTISARRINIAHANVVLNDPDHQWFLCCSAKVLFLHSPLCLMEYTQPNKSVYKIAGYEIPDSPITLWNGNYEPNITLNQINNRQTNWSNKTGDIAKEWACCFSHVSPKAIIFQEIVDFDYAELWSGYEEEARYGDST